MGFLVIKGNVSGTHRIADLGISLTYGQEARISLQEAMKSKDLATSIRTGHVLRVRVLVPPKRVPSQPQPQRALCTASPSENKDLEASDLLPSVSIKKGSTSSTEDLEALVRRLLDSQTKLVEVLLADRKAPRTYTQPHQLGDSSLPKVLTSREAYAEDAELADPDPVIFIPSQIRNPTTVVSEGFKPAEEVSSENENMTKAQNALKAMKPKSRRKRKGK